MVDYGFWVATVRGAILRSLPFKNDFGKEKVKVWVKIFADHPLKICVWVIFGHLWAAKPLMKSF